MKHMKYSTTARRLAILFTVIFGTLTLAGSVTILFTYEMKLYSNPLKNVISDQQESLQKFYSVKIFANREDNPACLKDSNLEYGIIKTNSIQDLDLSDKSIYTYQNFNKTTPDAKGSYAISFYENLTECYDEDPTLLESLTGHYNYFINDVNLITKSASIINIVYNEENGVFYYETPTRCFPIYHITVNSTNATTNKKAKDIIDANSIKNEDLNNPSFTLNKVTCQYESDSGLFEPLDTSNYKSWQKFSTEDNYWFSPSEISSTKKVSGILTESNEIWLSPSENNRTHYPTINYYASTTLSEQTYWIISNIKEPLNSGSNDLFVQQKNILTFLYAFRNPCIVITIFSFFVFLLLLGFCCYNIGCKANAKNGSPCWWYRIPLLLFLLAVILVCGVLASFNISCLKNLLNGNIAISTMVLLCVLSTAMAIFLLIQAIMNLCYRYQAGILERYTISHYIVSIVQRAYQFCCQNTSFLAKGIIIIGGLTFIDALLLPIINASGEGITLWIAIKILEMIAAFILLLQMNHLQKGSRLLAEGKLDNKLDTSHMLWEFKKHGEYLNQIGDGMSIALEERLKSELFKSELITNVSHDIKTPLTSIINYVDLLQKENITSETAVEYLEVLERQSARLKKLIEDLMEASKASTGNLTLNLEECDIGILLTQTVGEFEEKLLENQLELIVQNPESPIMIQADNRHLWRIFDNLMNNICKYAQPGTRVYINWEAKEQEIHIVFRNTSKYALNISGEELMERFVRGDASRNTDGNGLGLSIAQSLAELMNGTLTIYVDGDLFKVILTFPKST